MKKDYPSRCVKDEVFKIHIKPKMNIQYLTQLADNPALKGVLITKTLQPITIEEIESLEATYNNGNQFPAALSELLYLAGNYCYVLDYGIYDTQEEVQENSRQFMSDAGTNITRPYYVIDIYDAGNQCLFVYLDEGADDPMVYQASFWSDTVDVNEPWPNNLNIKLSVFLNTRLVSLLSGYNPF